MRNKPQQERAVATVERILNSSREVLTTSTYKDVTTAAIADHAFISIGTLYKYFQNKEGIYLRLYESTASRCATEMRHELMARVDSSIDESLRQLIGIMLDLHVANEAVLIRLMEQAPDLLRNVRSMAVENLVQQASHTYLKAHGHELNSPTKESCIYFLLRNAIVENIRRYIIEGRHDITRNMFLEELTRLACNYLQYVGSPVQGLDDTFPQ